MTNNEITLLKSQNEALRKQNESLQTDYNKLKGQYNTLDISFHKALKRTGEQAHAIKILKSALEQIADGEGNTCHGIIAKQALEKAKK